ncbi:probable amino acid permease 7 isoform X1 [Brachypodium distachyon]|uniref:probable amino acid permease 7 isoform X1 n=1 Tax=Brachypodium distachyon TaxID=15368 RepID=UPI000D0CD735|nr:probable amino acid permease 7 isoform X1 [Brachypodium distachyon]|eukprot:XP_024317975.1 probable amino acid permease 7 isoform X1 [Brachypodium distachyon]
MKLTCTSLSCWTNNYKEKRSEASRSHARSRRRSADRAAAREALGVVLQFIGGAPGGENWHGMDGDGAHHHGGDRLRRAVAGVERGAAGLGRGPGGHGVLRRGDRRPVLPARRLLHFPRPGPRQRHQEQVLRGRREAPPSLIVGEKSQMFCGFFIGVSLLGSGVVYTLTSANSMRAIQKANCYHRKGHGAPCSATAGGDGYYMLLFGLAQAVLSQIPDFHNMAWLSVFAAVMSFSYSSIGFGLGAAKVIENGVIKGGIGGITLVSPVQKVWRVAQALGDIAFAYPYSLVLLEIEDTLRSPPAESETMKAASRASIAVTTFFYLGCGCFGYAAFGDGTPGNLLTGFGFYEPFWLVDLANLCVVLHLLGGYQMYAQPAFALAERRLGAVDDVEVELPLLGRRRRVNVFRLGIRMAYVVVATAMAILFPYFNQVVGLIGAFTYWPLAIYFPVQMYLAQAKVAPWTGPWVAIQAFSAGCLLICAFASVGSAVGVFGAERS